MQEKIGFSSNSTGKDWYFLTKQPAICGNELVFRSPVLLSINTGRDNKGRAQNNVDTTTEFTQQEAFSEVKYCHFHKSRGIWSH